MPNRWALSRAGIVNVYQYGDETLHFAGGRLLLRGVNGSGKSTAMNMLLPFLLEAETRRIDAAGEQAGVLRSWMLSGRDELQPVGYLWIEFRRPAPTAGDPDEHLVCGCGIRANRSTDRVTTWWFVTARRPGIDLALVEAKTPLSVDALRAELGPNAVFAHDQRPAYRAELRHRLYSGAELDQHLRLLHIVRNPRVGDRIDLDLPSYLEDALPQLSEAALDDAAQPLEDLEEHRRNVEDLTRTASTLDALDVVYRNYARTELHQRADAASDLVATHRQRARDEKRIRDQQRDAETERTAAVAAIDQHAADERRLRQEIETLKSRDAYKAGADLTDLRDHVASLDAQVAKADADLTVRATRQKGARTDLHGAQSQAEGDHAALREQLTDLGRIALAAGLPLRAVDAPTVERHTVEVDVDDEVDDVVEVPTGAFDGEPLRRHLGDVRAAAHNRTGDVHEVRRTLDAVDRAERRVGDAERAVTAATEAEAAAALAFTTARAGREEQVASWRHSIAEWMQRLHAHQLDFDLPLAQPVDLTAPDLADSRNDVSAALFAAAQRAVDHHQAIAATLAARIDTERATVAELAAQLDELRTRTLPDPPATSWQRTERPVSLAELVDFQPGVSAADQAGLEAAMEAAGLLGAELQPDGFVVAGQLVARAGKPAENPLRSLLAVTVPDHLVDRVSADTVAALLDTISVEPDDLRASDDRTVVTTGGQFRIGVLRGAHAKTEAEHIGITARRAALERRRAEVTSKLAAAEGAVAASLVMLEHRNSAAAEATTVRGEVPPVHALDIAIIGTDNAEAQLRDRRSQLADRASEHVRAEAAHAEAVDASRRVASSHGLPHERFGLDAVDGLLRQIAAACDRAEAAVRTVVRSVGGWIGAGAKWTEVVGDARAAQQNVLDLQRNREPVAMKLATLEDTVGLEYDEIVATLDVSERDLKAALAAHEAARDRQLGAHGEVQRLLAEADAAADLARTAASRCVDALAHLRRALSVPGLLPSALHVDDPPASGSDDPPDDTAFPAVTEDPDGLRDLAQLVRARIAPPERATTGEGVRLSLRSRRDSLGAGWDAEDHQPDETLPLRVEVTGTLGGRMPLHDATVRVRSQLQTMASLLTAKQDQALRNLLQGLIAREVAQKMHDAKELVGRMNNRLDSVTTSHGIGVSLRWQRRDDLDDALASTIALLAKPPDLRTTDEEHRLTDALSQRIATARSEDPEAPYRQLIASVLDYRLWHRMILILRRPGRDDERLTRRTALSEGEKKMVSYLPLFAAVAASCDALAEAAPDAPRFVLLDDAFAKVSEDNHPKLFGLLVELDLDFIATSERLWGTHATVPELAITEVLRDADLGVIVLEHSRWDGRNRHEGA